MILFLDVKNLISYIYNYIEFIKILNATLCKSADSLV